MHTVNIGAVCLKSFAFICLNLVLIPRRKTAIVFAMQVLRLFYNLCCKQTYSKLLFLE